MDTRHPSICCHGRGPSVRSQQSCGAASPGLHLRARRWALSSIPCSRGATPERRDTPARPRLPPRPGWKICVTAALTQPGGVAPTLLVPGIRSIICKEKTVTAVIAWTRSGKAAPTHGGSSEIAQTHVSGRGRTNAEVFPPPSDRRIALS